MDHRAGMEMLRNLQGERTETATSLADTVSTAEKRLFNRAFTPQTPEQAEAQDAASRRYEAERHQSEVWNLIHAAGIPRRHNSSKLSEMLTSENWAVVYERVKVKLGAGMLAAFVGQRGTGKTQLAVELIKESCNTLRSGRYVKAAEFFREVRSAFRDGGPTEESVIKKFIRYDTLVIDEAHERGKTEFEDRTLTHVVDCRYDAMRDTILVSNDSVESFGKNVGPSIVSRLNETGELIEFNWASFR